MKYHDYIVTWSEDDEEYVGQVNAYPSLSHLAETAEEALAGIIHLVAEVEQDMVRDTLSSAFEYACHATLLGRTDTHITFPVDAQLTGYRLRDIHVRLTAAEFVDPHVRAWLLEVVLPRRASVDEAVQIELSGR